MPETRNFNQSNNINEVEGGGEGNGSSNSNNNKNIRICIIGAGLAGSMMAILLGKLGYRITVYEKREDPRANDLLNDEFGPVTSPSKRSINLALSYRGILGLKEIGVLDKVMVHAIPMPCRVIHHFSGRLSQQPYGNQDECIWSICRNTLNNILLQAASEYSNISIYYGYTITSIDKTGTCHIRTQPDDFVFPCQFDLVIGADGAFSTVRSEMMKIGRVNYSRQFIDMGYKELRIPPRIDENGQKHYALDFPNGLHIWPRGKLMLIALPNEDKSFTATLFAPYSGLHGFTSLTDSTDETIEKFIHQYFPDIVSVMPHILREFRTHPVGSLMTSRVNPWCVGRILLIGDAAHAILPFLGQGMNSAFEDAYQFYKLLQNNDYNLYKSSQLFNKSRQPSIEILANMSEEHYKDMAIHTTSLYYQIKKRFERFIRFILPNGWYIPQYTMIAFTDIPYNQIQERNDNQNISLTFIFSIFTILTIGVFTEGSIYIQKNGNLKQLTDLFQSNIVKLFRSFRR